jgi:hypothetical protein
MLRSMNDLESYAIGATDGPIGHVKDFYFDDDAWVIRYLVVETGTWLSGRKVLISPISIRHPKWDEQLLPVSLTREQIQKSPSVDIDQPVSREHELEYAGYYGYPHYWEGTGVWGGGLYPFALAPGYVAGDVSPIEREQSEEVEARAARVRRNHDDPQLRSCQAVCGYHLRAIDGEIGHVESMLVDEDTWEIRYLVVNTSNWWMGHKVVISPEWITGVHWSEEIVSVSLTRAAIQAAPPYESAAQMNLESDAGLSHHYRQVGHSETAVVQPADL